MVKLMENGNLAAIHAKRVTIMPKDIQLVMKMMNITAAYKTNSVVTGRREEEPSKDDVNKALQKIKRKRDRQIVSSDSESDAGGEKEKSSKFRRIILRDSDFETENERSQAGSQDDRSQAGSQDERSQAGSQEVETGEGGNGESSGSPSVADPNK